MKRIISLFCTLICLISLFGCESSNISDRYIEAISVVKNDLKDPSSMRIYGDVIVAKFNEENSSIISLIYDAKNGFGGYGGKTEVIIMLTPDSDPVYVAEDSPYFMDIRDTYEEIEELSQNIESGKVEKSETTDRILNTISFEVLQGDKVADLLKIEHYDN